MPMIAAAASELKASSSAGSGACKRRANYLKPKEIGVRSIVAALGLQPASIYLKLKTLGIRAGRQCRS
ncbi:hypothetical protein [Bradyrhizobium sp.]|uniref:hypothetical protein n=1 Tax=Bradyrhizobium sp. TaxID=376 RepID=UPI000AEE6C8C|nr:hypothetical protein [Bradyrhizobium sp.]